MQPAKSPDESANGAGHWSATFAPPRTKYYLLALGAVALTLAGRLTVSTWLEEPTLIIFSVPIILTAYFGGLGPGLAASFLAVLSASYYLLPPLHSFVVASSTQRWQQAILAA